MPEAAGFGGFCCRSASARWECRRQTRQIPRIACANIGLISGFSPRGYSLAFQSASTTTTTSAVLQGSLLIRANGVDDYFYVGSRVDGPAGPNWSLAQSGVPNAAVINSLYQAEFLGTP